MTDEHGEYLMYEITERSAAMQVLDPGAPATPMFGYGAVGGDPTVPGPLIKVDQNTRVKLRVRNDLPPVHPTFGYEVAHLGAPPRVGVAAAVRRVRRRRDACPATTRTTGTRTTRGHGRSGTTTTACTTPRRTSTAASLAQYHLQNPWEKENLPQGPYDVPLTISDAMFARNGSLAYMDRDHSGPVG